MSAGGAGLLTGSGEAFWLGYFIGGCGEGRWRDVC